MELRHLRYFVAVAEELHFGRAAARLHLAQPALSQQIRRLEEQLSLQLFQRTKRRVTLTEPGHVLLEKARLLLTHADEAVRSVQRASRGEIGELFIGFVGSAAQGILPEILKVFRKRFPDIRLSLQELTTSQQVTGLRSGRIRVGFLRPPVAEPDVETETVAREPWVVAVPHSHRLRARSIITLRELATEPFIGTPRALGPGFYDQVYRLCLQSGFSPRVVQEAIQMQTIVALVKAGLGVALVPQSIAKWSDNGVLYKRIRGSPTVELALAWRRGDSSPVLRSFVSVVKELREAART
jgi:DNA-binding transcriptional LysR family regulator